MRRNHRGIKSTVQNGLGIIRGLLGATFLLIKSF